MYLANKIPPIVPSNISLTNLHPFLDSNNILRIGGRDQNSKFTYYSMLSGHPQWQTCSDQGHNLNRASPSFACGAYPPLLLLNRKFYIVSGRKSVNSITCGCVACRRHAEKPKLQQVGQLPIECVTPDLVFENVGMYYAGPVICIFVSLTVKAAHLELTTDAFLSALRRFIRGKPKLLCSDHGTNFVGAHKELIDFLKDQQTQKVVSQLYACIVMNCACYYPTCM